MTPELQYLTWQRVASQRQAQGNAAGAAEAYRQALAKAPDWTNTSKQSGATWPTWRWQAGNTKEAVAQYDALRGRYHQGRVCGRDAVSGRQCVGASGQCDPGHG